MRHITDHELRSIFIQLLSLDRSTTMKRITSALACESTPPGHPERCPDLRRISPPGRRQTRLIRVSAFFPSPSSARTCRLVDGFPCTSAADNGQFQPAPSAEIHQGATDENEKIRPVTSQVFRGREENGSDAWIHARGIPPLPGADLPLPRFR